MNLLEQLSKKHSFVVDSNGTIDGRFEAAFNELLEWAENQALSVKLLAECNEAKCIADVIAAAIRVAKTEVE